MAIAGRWELPASVPTIYVDTQDTLQQLSEVLGVALCCAIDAEWPPEETTQEGRSGGPPHATLVQLALVLVPGTALPAAARTAASGGASARSSTSCCVLLLDLLRLPQAAVKQALQALFRSRGCLKLGWGLVHDLRAIAAALGGEGGSCIAVVDPACDLGSMHRFLRHRGARGVHKAVDLGLSGLVEAQLGRPLDKQLQCSAWGERPLSAEQRRYAAADAACLLALLGSFVAAVGQPEEWPMGDDSSSSGGGGCGGAAAAAPALSSEAAAAGEEVEEQEEEGEEEGEVAEAVPAQQQQQQEQQQPVAPALLGACSLRRCAQAAPGLHRLPAACSLAGCAARADRHPALCVRRDGRGAGPPAAPLRL